MKRALFCILAFICLLLAVCPKISAVYAAGDNRLEFLYADRVFEYDLNTNRKESSQFDLNYEINKYNRFGTLSERKNLLKQMLKANFSIEVALNYLCPNLNKTINRIEKNVAVEPQDAKLHINSNSNKVFNISQERVGCKLDKAQLYSDIAYNFLNDKPLKFNLPTIELKPKIYKKDYEKFAHLRADFSTNISSSSADRKHNVKNALNSLNKVEIAPNQVFSFNKTVGRRTQENGYREAKIIVNNEFVDGLGGGVCQVSTTLYNAALLAGLEIVEANKHSKQVNYVKYGFDAMVNFGSSDLKFKNNTNEKITIITNFSASSARIRIFGAQKSEEYKLTNEIVSITEPGEDVIIDFKQEYADKVMYEDESFYLKRGSKGMEIKSFRDKYIDGKFVARETLRYDKFKAQNAVKVYGAKKRDNLFVLDALSAY